jgi:hypothetical protein
MRYLNRGHQMTSKNVQPKFDTYPTSVKLKLLELRSLILDFIERNNLGDFEEKLKWGESSYLVKGVSTVRIDWKPKAKDKYFIFFNCKTKLVDTFRELYSDVLHLKVIKQ